MRRAHGASAIAVVAGLALALASGGVDAQSARQGVRVRIGQIATSGGLSGSAFLPMPTSAVSVTSLGGACTRIAGTARLARGPVRAVELALRVTAASQRVSIAEAEPVCEGATIRLALEDGSTIALERGDLDVVRNDPAGGSLEARFAGTGSRAGDPITVTGDMRLAFAPSPVR